MVFETLDKLPGASGGSLQPEENCKGGEALGETNLLDEVL